MARLDDGHPTRLNFSSYPNVKLWEKEVTPPGIEGGGANDTTTMHNVTWRTRAPKKLKTLSDASGTYAYDPDCYTDLDAMINVNQQITITFSDNSTVTFWGWIDQFTPQRITEGSQPTAEVTIIPSNQDASGAEAGPVVT